MLRIYISSTYQDLVDQRQATRDAVEALGYFPAGMETYAASDQRPLDRCLNDVRSCDAYIAIIAWRYGYRPQLASRSITMLEYEEARANKIPCHIFLLEENAAWPRSSIPDEDQTDIKAFREELKRDHVVGWFRDAETLALAVTRSLVSAFAGRGSGPAVPDILPYLCDRSDQEFAFRGGIERAKEHPDRPLFCIVHGNESEAHDKFLERVHTVMLPMLLDLNSQGQSVHLIHLEWPPTYRDAGELHNRLEWNLLKEVLDPPKGNREGVNRELQRLTVPVAIHSHLSTDTWRPNALSDYVDFWRKWEELGVGQQLIILLFVTYKEKKNLTPERLQQLQGKNANIRQIVETFDFAPLAGVNGTVLPELLGATLGEAENWARGEDTTRFCNPQALVTKINEFYEEWEAREQPSVEPVRIPTSHLAPKLRDLISQTLTPEARTS